MIIGCLPGHAEFGMFPNTSEYIFFTCGSSAIEVYICLVTSYGRTMPIFYKTVYFVPIVENLSTDVDIFIPRLSDDEESAPSLFINLTLGGFAVVEFNVSDANTTQHVTIQPIDHMGLYLLCCLIHAGENISSTMPCEANATLPIGLLQGEGGVLVSESDLAEADYTWQIPREFLDIEGEQVKTRIFSEHFIPKLGVKTLSKARRRNVIPNLGVKTVYQSSVSKRYTKA